MLLKNVLRTNICDSINAKSLCRGPAAPERQHRELIVWTLSMSSAVARCRVILLLRPQTQYQVNRAAFSDIVVSQRQMIRELTTGIDPNVAFPDQSPPCPAASLWPPSRCPTHPHPVRRSCQRESSQKSVWFLCVWYTTCSVEPRLHVACGQRLAIRK